MVANGASAPQGFSLCAVKQGAAAVSDRAVSHLPARGYCCSNNVSRMKCVPKSARAEAQEWSSKDAGAELLLLQTLEGCWSIGVWTGGAGATQVSLSGLCQQLEEIFTLLATRLCFVSQ